MLTVTVNDRPVDVTAIVEQGRVLLPLRATFSALGASIRYDPSRGVIVARSAAHTLRLTIGSESAVVDGRDTRLDTPPRVIAMRTYVPLRFIAQALGAIVGYDARASIVSIVTPTPAIRVVDMNPAPGTNVSSAYPTISASLGSASATPQNVMLAIDGTDVTAAASFDGSTITYMPRMGLSRGAHTVTFSGRTTANDAFSATWSFQTSLQAPPDAPAMSQFDYRFYANGPSMYYPGDWMHFTLVAPPGGSAELRLCDLGFQYGMWSSQYGGVYEANFPAPNGYWMPSCAVTAVYTAWNGQQYFVPIPILIGLYTGPQFGRPTPTPAPAPHRIPHPTGPRRTLPSRGSDGDGASCGGSDARTGDDPEARAGAESGAASGSPTATRTA